MTRLDILLPIVQLAVGAAAGGLLAWGYFNHLRRTASLFVSGAPPLRALLETIARLSAAGLVFFALTNWSALAAIGALIGFSIGRQRAIIRARLG